MFADIPLSLESDINFKTELFDHIKPIDDNNSYSAFEQSAYSLLGHHDRQSYVRKKGFELTFQKRFTKYFDLNVFYTNQKYLSLQNGTTFSLRDNGKVYDENLTIENKREDELGLSLQFKEYDHFKLGAFETEQFLKNGWDVDLTFKLNANNSTLSFKEAHFEGLKDFRFGRTQLQFKGVAHYKGEQSSINNLFYPTIYSLMSTSNNFHVSGFGYYSLSSFDYYSFGASLAFHRLIPWFRPGSLYLNAMSFTGNNYGIEKLNGIKILDSKVYHELGIAFKTSRLFLPIRVMANYNTLLKSRTYKIDFSFGFD